ncbi:MAG: ribosome maturation factor RimM [Pseudomonadota bacterium]
MTQEYTLVIGEVVGIHGIRGVLKVRSHAESPDIFLPDTPVFLGGTSGEKNRYMIQWVKPHKKGLLMALDGVTECNRAEALVGMLIYIDAAALPELGDDTYYWFELIGMSVFTVQNEYLGRVTSIMPTGSNDVLVVRDPVKGPQHEVLIPALATVVQSVNLQEKRIRVTLPEGL